MKRARSASWGRRGSLQDCFFEEFICVVLGVVKKVADGEQEFRREVGNQYPIFGGRRGDMA